MQQLRLLGFQGGIRSFIAAPTGRRRLHKIIGRPVRLHLGLQGLRVEDRICEVPQGIAHTLSMFRPPGLEQSTLDEHTAIVDAIEVGNPERAAKAIADHLNRANQLYQGAHHAPQGQV